MLVLSPRARRSSGNQSDVSTKSILLSGSVASVRDRHSAKTCAAELPFSSALKSSVSRAFFMSGLKSGNQLTSRDVSSG